MRIAPDDTTRIAALQSDWKRFLHAYRSRKAATLCPPRFCCSTTAAALRHRPTPTFPVEETMKTLPAIALSVLLAFAKSAYSEEIKCSNMNAKAHYDSTSSAAKTETSSSCTISIDGADANSHGVPLNALWCITSDFRSQKGSRILSDLDLVEFSIPLFVLPTLEDAHGGSNLTIPSSLQIWPPSHWDIHACNSWLDNLSRTLRNENVNPSDLTALHGSFSSLSYRLFDDFVDCYRNERTSTSFSCRSEGSSMQISFDTSFGSHTIGLPQ